jgi:DNA (cytosine-5)-methyltransferase 1
VHKPKALDLFCGAGGASMGLHRAGFDVTGVDIKPQPRYPFAFIQADAMECPLDGFDFIWASPPCQGYTLMQHMGKRAGEAAPKLIEPIRKRLMASGSEWVIENVVGAPLQRCIVLCGSMFGLGVRRHRLFEASVLLLQPTCQHEPNKWPVAVWGDGRPSRQEARREHRGPIAVYGDHPEDSAIHRAANNYPGLTRRAATLEVGRRAMDIDWMDWNELTESIPPAYSEFIGKQAMQFIESELTK